MADEAASGSDGRPSATAGWVVLVIAFPGELGAGRSVTRAVANVEEAGEGSKDDLAIRAALERDVRLLDKVEEVIAPSVHLDDAPTTGEGFCEGGDLGHQQASASSLGRRTRL